MIVAGIDPGLGGALALIEADTLDILDVTDMPVQQGARGKREIVDPHLIDLLTSWRAKGCALVVYEAQQAMPRQGVTSAYRIGLGEGVLRCAICAAKLPFEIVHPATWKRAMGLTAEKADSRALARQLFPMAPPMLGRRKDEGRAEALLLAAYAARRWRSAA